jgi:hypothetical protein
VGLFSRKRTDVPAAATASGAPAPGAPEQSVITHLRLSDEQFGTHEEREAVFALEARIVAAVSAIGCDHDGNEFGGGEATLFTYGPDADAMLVAIQEALQGYDVRAGSYAVKRYGRAQDPHAREERVELA